MIPACTLSFSFLVKRKRLSRLESSTFHFRPDICNLFLEKQPSFAGNIFRQIHFQSTSDEAFESIFIHRQFPTELIDRQIVFLELAERVVKKLSIAPKEFSDFSRVFDDRT